jgi:YD repeat-containing protein
MGEKRAHWSRFTKVCAFALLAGLGSIATYADQTWFEYDALGRLIEVERSDGVKTIYRLDAAGNRSEVKEGIPPGIPASITIPATSSSGSYTVTWTAPTTGTVTAYELYESMTDVFTLQTLVYSGSATSKSFTSKPNGYYYYRVRACGIECSGYQTGAGRVQVRPGAPASISSPAESTTGTYTVSWAAATGSFTRYELEEATNAQFDNATRVHNNIATRYDAMGLGNGTYHYRVRACGNSGPCSIFRDGAQTTVILPPGAPLSISVPTTSSSGDYFIGWGQAASGTVTTYELYESGNSSFTGATLIHKAASAGLAITGKNTGVYYYRVRACYLTSCGAYTTGGNSLSVDRVAPSSTGTPTFSVNGTTVTATWSAATDNIGVVRYETSLNGAAIWTNNALSTSRTISGLQPFTPYSFAVRAVDAVGLTGTPASSSFTTGTDAPPQPTALQAAPYSSCSWRATWAASPGATYYKFKALGSEAYDVSGSPVDVNFSCTTDTYETRKPEYVKACNAIACSLATAFFSTDVTNPTTPGIPQFSAVTPNSATATWTPSTDASGIVAYHYNLNAQGWVTIGTVATVGLVGLAPSTDYTLQVRARDGAGRTGSHSQATFRTPDVPDTTDPGQPGALSFTDVTYYNARATWGAATDNVGVVRYEYRLNGQSWINAGNVLTLVVTGLGADSVYQFDVRAVDGANRAGPLRNNSFTTAPRPPDAPTGLSRTQVQDCSWRASWSAVPGAAKYRVGETNGTTQPYTTSTSTNVSCSPGNPNGNKPEWVQACTSANVCGERAYF